MGFFDKLKGIFNKPEDSKVVIEKAPAPERKPIVVNPVAEEKQESIYNIDFNRNDAYFDNLINETNFPDYTIYKKVEARNFDGFAHPSCYPISYLFAKDSRPVLAVLVMKKNQPRSMIAKGTYKVLDDKGIPYIRFYREMKNDNDYVINRITENLR